MRTKSFAGLVLMLALALPMAAAAVPTINHLMINKDLVNKGPAAYDLAIVLEGTQGILDTFDGYDSGPILGYFDPPTVTPAGSNIVVHWQNFFDKTDNKIDTNQKIHVGVEVPTTSDSNRKILDMYWTDGNGNRIPGSIVHNVSDGVTYSSNGHLSWTLANAHDIAVSVKNIRYAVLPAPLSLDQLSQQNTELATALRPLSDGVVVDAGGSVALDLPVSVAPGSAVVLVYDETAEGSMALVTNYAQAAVTQD